MPMLAKTLLSAVTVTGPGASIDLASLTTNQTFHVISSSDPGSLVSLEGSLDNVNFYGMGEVTGTGILNNDQTIAQYVRANVVSLASGSVTAYVGKQ